VLAEVDYLKPYWDVHPEDRADLRELMRGGRLEIMGGAYNEPNTNLTGPETTIRNFVHGTAFQRDILGGDPRTAWQLDVFGHDPQFPGMAAGAGLTSSSWARGPFHQWGPMRGRVGDPGVMQFRSEFDWIAPSGRALLTSYMPDHYSSGWDTDAAPTLERAEQAAYVTFAQLRKGGITRNVLYPVGTDHTPPNKWVTAIHHDWNSRYTWPRFVCSLPRDYFDAVRAELAERDLLPSPQTRDMNPVYTGKDVSYIDTKQANRAAEHAVLDAERFAVFACLLGGASYPEAALAKAWVQLAYGAHHDAITGSESDQVYLDLLTSWRDAWQLGTGARDAALRLLTAATSTDTGPGRPVTVWNPLARERSDLVTVRLAEPVEAGTGVFGAGGEEVPALVEHGGSSVTFRAENVGSLGWRTFRLAPGTAAGGWHPLGGQAIANEHYRIEVDAERGGGVRSLVELATGRELIAPERVGNELAVYDEYPQHPQYGEGPWHLLPKGPPAVTSAGGPAEVTAMTCPIGQRLVVRGSVGPLRYTQTITLWGGVPRIDCVTTADEFTGVDRLLRLRWPCPVAGALPVSEVGDAVIGRGFGLVDVDSGPAPWTLDNPAYTWFGLSATATALVGGVPRAMGVAEVVAPSERDAGSLCRDVMVALVRAGVTGTCSWPGRPRYGHLTVDSNLPDVRIALGAPDRNEFTAAVLDAADPAYADELRRQLGEAGRARVWVPALKALAESWLPGADLRDPRALPVLVVAGADDAALAAAIRELVEDLADAEIVVDQDAPAGPDPGYEGRTVALLNRGVPGFAVDTGGTLHASLMRSCTGWPSGVWIDPPRRTAPDGSNFQL
ncbi:MAG TPA: glycoside hydrolase family 38 C-terminal domain-containing protein, partial [Pseudonocardiaceae bacterium]|nr:glycoside hydrolase family 38 C-terminal domain-containing protein [Pseudonocardiaceae bacterium]